MSEVNAEKEPTEEEKFPWYMWAWVWFLIFSISFGVFYITPARVIFNRVFNHSIECTVDSSKASSSGTRSLATHSYYLDVYTTDCGHLSETRNFSAEDTARKLNEMKGQKITVNIGYLPWYFEGKEINGISAPEGL